MYLNNQFSRFIELIESISSETFWQVLPEILGIDAKFSLLKDLIAFDDFSDEEIIKITENDYLIYFKELCGYNLKMKTEMSLIFNVR